jgi:hypothetical protein
MVHFMQAAKQVDDFSRKEASGREREKARERERERERDIHKSCARTRINKKCVQGLRLTALLSPEGKRVFSLSFINKLQI